MNKSSTNYGESSLSPTVVIYQNADFVSVLLQEIFKQGLLQTAEYENSSISGMGDESSKEIKAGTKAKFVPWVVGLDVHGGYGGRKLANEEVAETQQNTFVYSQEYYLDHVKSELRRQELITEIHGAKDAASLKVGDFIEFEASFEANEVNAILDILTPDLIAAIARYLQLGKGHEEIDQVMKQAADAGVDIPVQRISGIREVHKAKAENRAAIAAAVASAIRMDFRGAETKEFYATVGSEGDSLTVITVCEKQFFKSKDSDRLLDGSFTVLGKVVSTVRKDVPILERNKLLSRLRVEALDEIVSPMAEDADAKDFVNLEFKTSIEGESITILPLAVYV